LIEYNGDYWHCNPLLYEPDYFHDLLDMTAKEKWDNDSKKISFAKDKGYKVLVVWERDYKNNKDKIVKMCESFLCEE